MAIPQFQDDLNIISKLGDNPGTDNGLTTPEFRAKFDAAGLAIQKFINEHIIPAIRVLNNPEEGLAMKGNISMGGNKILDLADPTDASHATNKQYVDKKLPLDGSIPMIGNLKMGDHMIVGLRTPENNDHAANKLYVDEAVKNVTSESISAMSMSLLWMNASANSNFLEQDLTIPNLEKYGWIVIGAKTATDNNILSWYWFRRIDGYWKMETNSQTDAGKWARAFIRTMIYSSDAPNVLSFKNAIGTGAFDSDETEVNNKCLVPFEIYGVTGGAK